MKKVLIVDDDVINLMVLFEMLSIIFPNVQVTQYSSALEVLSDVNLTQYDLFLSDIDMPKMDGYELYTKLREEKHITQTVVAITALAVQGDRDRILLHGFDAYISKPIDMNDLQTILTPFIEEK
ncbi:MAG TPA: response regulator [Helicobacteraceae bacterium]|nr:response regulator [Helicobacteraceae bacterium]